MISSLRGTRWLKLGLTLAVSALVTLLIVPHLTLVPVRIQAGDMIRDTIIIPDNLTLEDERSTETRRQQALADFAPVYDYDNALKQKTLQALSLAFQRVRDAQTAMRQALAEAQDRLRQTSLDRIALLSSQNDAAEDVAKVAQEKSDLLHQIGMLSDLPSPNGEQQLTLDKLRLDLRVIDAQRAALEATQAQLKGRAAQLETESRERLQEVARLRQDDAQSAAKLRTVFEGALGSGVDESTFRALLDAGFGAEVEELARSLLVPVLDSRVISSREDLPAERKAIQLRLLDGGQQERFDALDTLVDLAEVRRMLAKSGQALKPPAASPALRAAVVVLDQRIARPNLTENKGETERQRGELLKSITPVYFNLKKGDVVAKAGDVASPQQAEILRALTDFNLKNPKYPQIVGTFLIVLMTLTLLYQFLRLGGTGAETRISRLLLMAILLVATLGLAQLLLVIMPALTAVYPFIPAGTYSFLIPAALTSLLASILLRFEVAVYLGLLVSLCLAVMLGNSLPFLLYSLLGSLVAAIPMRHFDTRFALWQQGLRISAVNVPVILVLALMDKRPLGWSLLLDAGAGLLNGLGVAFLAATILPLLEKAFDITTNLRLLELSNMNQPALKELAVRAPGTYHHSIVVGNLSESAADGIGAHSLLVRVAAYYHDLGKMLCPLYFVENQHQKNFHDDLPAQTSARIIINHVRDGLEIAKRHKLGKAIMDIIAQHHGDSLVRYFYHKAQEELADPGTFVPEEQFHYPGPKPQTKEAGLVMVADVTEAAIRSLDDPSPEEIRQMVQKLATRIYMEGQLDQSGLTFNDLNYIEKTFTRMLLSIHHHRITYPEVQASGQKDLREAHRESSLEPGPPRPQDRSRLAR